MNNEANDSNISDNEKLEKIGNIFTECFEIELAKLSEEESKNISSTVLNMFMRTKLHTLFTTESLQKNVSYIFENILIRDFILSLSDKAGIMIGLNSEYGRFLEERIACGISQISNEEKDLSNCLIPEKIMNNLGYDYDTIKSVLKSNRWFMIIVLINLFLYKTSLFNENKKITIYKDLKEM